MKKLFHISFPHVFGLHTVKRFVFENPGETKSLALQGFEGNKEADIDAAAKEGKRGMDKALKDGNEAIDRKAAEYRKKYEGKDDKDAAEKAINAARDAAKVKLEAKHKAAMEALRQNSVTASTEAANALVQDRKEKAKGKYPDNQLEKYSVGESILDWKPEGKNYTDEDMSDGAFKEIMVGMLRAVYVAEGEEAANALLERMKKGKEVMDFSKMKYDKDFNLAQGVEHDPPLIQFDPDVTSGNYNSRSLAGKIFGLNHAADNRIKDAGVREKYKAYLAEAGRQAGKAKDATQVDAIQTPDEWIAAHPEHKEAAAEVDQEKLDKERLSKINDYLKDFPADKGWEKDQLRGILMGRLQGENDPAKWLDLMREAGAKAYGVSVDAYKDTSWGDLNKDNAVSKYIKEQQKDMGKYLLDDEKNHDGQGRGYVAGLLMAAEQRYKDNPALLRKYREELKAVTESDDFGKKVRANLNDSDHYDRLMKDEVWGKGEEQDEKNWEVRRKLGEANAALFNAARAALPTPDKYEESHKDKASEKADKFPREAYVDGLLANMPAEKSKERDQLRGMLMAAIGTAENPDGSKKTPAEMAKLVKPVLDAMGINDTDHKVDAATQADLDKILQGRTAFGENGKKLDLSSKGYLAALLYQAEQQYKDNPKLLEAYKKHLTDSVNTDEYKAANEEKMTKIKKYQDYLEDPVISKKLSLEERRTYLEGIAELTNQLLQETSKATKSPESYKESFDKDQTKEKEKIAGENKAFLDKYSDQVENYKKAGDALKAIMDEVPEANRDAAYKAKRKELEDKLKDPKVKNEADRFAVLAAARGFVDHKKDDKVPEARYEVVVQNYVATKDIMAKAEDKKKYGPFLDAIGKDKSFGYTDAAEIEKAKKAVDDAKPEDKAKVLAQQVLRLYKDAPGKPGAKPGDPAEKPVTNLTEEDFDTYKKYLEEKAAAKKAEDDKKKSNPPKVGGGSGGAGGSGSGGTPGGPGGGAKGPGATPGGGGPKPGPAPTPGDKDKPAPKETKETMDADKLLGVLKATVSGVLAKYAGVEFDKPAADLVKEIKGALEAAAGALKGKYDCSKITVPVSYKDASGVGLSLTPPETYALDATAINEDWVKKNMKEKQKEETKEDVEKQVNAAISRFNAEFVRLTGGNFNDKNTGTDVMNAILAGWKGGSMPADLLAKVAKYPDFKDSLKPEYWFAHRDVLFSNGQKQVTIRMKYRADGKVYLQPTNEKKPDYL